MFLTSPSPMERHILDLLDRIERQRTDRIVMLEEQVAALQTEVGSLRAQMTALERGVTALSNSLGSFLVPPGLPPT